MVESNVNLAALIGSRICHDLISPIGAITNGLELLDMSRRIDGPELELIADSVGHAGARIRFFRIAFGAAGDQQLGPGEIAAVLEDLGRGSRVRGIWEPERAVPRTEVRLAFLAYLCCEAALPAGGSVSMTQDRGTWTVIATGPRIVADPDLWEALDRPGGPRHVSPAQVQFALMPVLAHEAGRPISVTRPDGQIAIGF